MSLLDRAERRFGRYGIRHLTLGIIVGQVLFFLAQFADRTVLERLVFVPDLVLQGEVWRVFTFIFYPQSLSPIWFFIGMYVLYLMGTALEQAWGAFRYTVYLAIGYLATVAVFFVFFPTWPASNGYLLGSIFLAFAFLFPDFEFLLFFIFPVKVKYLAALTWILYIYSAITGSWPERALIFTAVANFLVFFGKDVFTMARHGRSRMQRRARFAADKKATTKPEDAPFHVCAECGKTDKTHPKMEFRYCDECDGHHGYCEEHVHNHVHIKAGA